MKKIGIIGAMTIEVETLCAKLENMRRTDRAGMRFCEGKLHGAAVVICQSGIGKVNAAMCTQILADDFHVDAVINTGIAGSLNKDIDIGDIVLSTDTLEHDMDAVAFGYPVGQIPRMDTLSFTADDHLRKVAVSACKKAIPAVHVFEGRVVSGDQFISENAVKEKLIREFQGDCAEMEGASIAHGAYLNHIPFVIIRAISDKADNSAEMDYPTFERAAAKHSAALVEELVKNI